MRHPELQETGMLVRAALDGMYDKSGLPLFDHCLRVSELIQRQLQEWGREDEECEHLGLLHDILEDGRDVDESTLLDMGYSRDLVIRVQCLTIREGWGYKTYIENICSLGDWQTILAKIADNSDNTEPWRLASLDRRTRISFIERYRWAREQLLLAWSERGFRVEIGEITI